MCKKCDNPEGNLCKACEREVQEVKAEVASDGWWPMVAVGVRSINIASTVAAAQLGVDNGGEMLYV